MHLEVTEAKLFDIFPTITVQNRWPFFHVHRLMFQVGKLFYIQGRRKGARGADAPMANLNGAQIAYS